MSPERRGWALDWSLRQTASLEPQICNAAWWRAISTERYRELAQERRLLAHEIFTPTGFKAGPL